MKVKKPLMVAGVASVMALSSAAGMALTSADTTSTNDGKTSLIDKIATKFNLKKTDVQAVFDQDRSEHQAAREKEVKADLDQAVKDGKLTAQQETLLIAKQSEMKTFMESLKDKTDAERKSAMDAKRTELQTWAKDNGIANEYLRLGIGHGHGGPGGPGGDMGGDGSTQPASTN
jgi:hypothetical protein